MKEVHDPIVDRFLDEVRDAGAERLVFTARIRTEPPGWRVVRKTDDNAPVTRQCH